MAQLDLNALANEGISEKHATAFINVAKAQNTIIITRTPGKSCLGLLTEGYDAKSFHIKAKSCNWGPMAGFLCLDPLMNKNGLDGAISNAKENYKSLTVPYDPTFDATKIKADQTISQGNTAGIIPIRISQARFDGLQKDGKMTILSGTESRFFGTATTTDNKVSFSYMFKKEGTLWALFYCLEDAYKINQKGIKESHLSDALMKLGATLSTDVEGAKKEKDALFQIYGKLLNKCPESTWETYNGKRYVPVLAMTNPNANYSKPEELYLNAITGDYDLFSVWPQGTSSQDKRVSGMSSQTTDKQIVAGENQSKIGQTVGNISERIYLIGQLINSEMVSLTKQTPNRVFHSDEGGRPFVGSVDLPVAIFTPDGEGYITSTLKELGNIIDIYAPRGYSIFVNKGWVDALLNIVDEKGNPKSKPYGQPYVSNPNCLLASEKL